ncbi:MAG: diguanylate cyclase [Methylococcaceae bacterium]|nr:diguanylate cyclase [Methylococcaceae bacterium]
MKILVIDACKISRTIVAESALVLGHEIYHAATGREGLAFAKENNIDLMFMDADMTDLNSLVATKAIRAFKKEDWFPIIFLSNKSDTDFYTHAMLAGADAYLQKPINPSYLQLQITAMERICLMRSRLQGHKKLIVANEHLTKLAMFDQLTGLPNRRHFEETLNREFNLAKRDKATLTILVCDIDFFKVYNDKYGHQEGDKCLKKIADAIDEVLTRPADLASRYGGEEFIVILPRTDLAGGLKVAEKIRQSVYDKNIALLGSKGELRVTLSLGLANYTGQYTNTDELIKAADDALYKSKKNGRNRVEKA